VFNNAPRRVQSGGWARQVTQYDFQISEEIAGVNMRLTRGGIRELHWHLAAEWAYMLMAFHFDLSVIALIGIILLIGIVKKNAIMLIDFALEAERNQGINPEESIYQACVLRFRPILMTTMAALLGGVPLMLGTGSGAEIRQPLGYSIVGGLILSQLLTLYTTPVVYLYLDPLSGFLGRLRQGGRRPREPGATPKIGRANV